MTRRNSWREGDGERALLLETSRGRGVALTPDGRFLSVRCGLLDEEGQEILLGRHGAVEDRFGPDVRRRPVRTVWGLRPGLAAAMALVVCFALLSPLAVGRVLASGKPVAYVSLDINPSVEFAVNRWDRVVTGRPLNSDGEELLASFRWRGRLLDDVVFDAGAAATSLGFLGGGAGEVVLAVVPAGPGAGVPPGLNRQLEDIRARLADRLGGDGSGVTVETLVADAATVRGQAEKLGLSVGRYALLLVAQENGLNLHPADLEHGVGRAILDAGGHPGEILRKAHEERKLSKLAEKFKERNGLGNGGDESDGAAPGNGQGSAPAPGESGGQARDQGQDHGRNGDSVGPSGHDGADHGKGGRDRGGRRRGDFRERISGEPGENGSGGRGEGGRDGAVTEPREGETEPELNGEGSPNGSGENGSDTGVGESAGTGGEVEPGDGTPGDSSSSDDRSGDSGSGSEGAPDRGGH